MALTQAQIIQILRSTAPPAYGGNATASAAPGGRPDPGNSGPANPQTPTDTSTHTGSSTTSTSTKTKEHQDSRTGMWSNTQYGSNTSFDQHPYITAQYGALGNLLRDITTKRLQNPTSLPAGYEQSQIRNLNRSFDTVNKALVGRLTQQGLAGSPASVLPQAAAERDRASKVADILSSTPLLERQMRSEDLDRAAAILDTFGKGIAGGSSTSGFSNTQGGSHTVSDLLSSVLSRSTTNSSDVWTTPYHPPVIPQAPQPGIGSIIGGILPVILAAILRNNRSPGSSYKGPGTDVTGAPLNTSYAP